MEHYQADLAQQVHDKDAAVQKRFSPTTCCRVNTLERTGRRGNIVVRTV